MKEKFLGHLSEKWILENSGSYLYFQLPSYLLSAHAC
jgi:hypothetical protein